MSNLILSIIAGIIIGVISGFPRSVPVGAIWGGCLGYLFFAVGLLRTRLNGMELVLERLEVTKRDEAQAGAHTKPPAPAAAPAPLQSEDIIDLVESVEVAHVFRREEPLLHTETTQHSPARPPLSPGRPLAGPESPFSVWAEHIGSGENLLVKLGVIILFFGVAFLVKYATQHGLFPLELRLTAAALGGCVLLAVGWQLREKRPVYAQVIQGGGVGIFYLTIFAAMRLYHLIPTMAGFAFLVTVCILAGTLAVLQDAPPLAVLGSAGGFLAPELAAIGSGSHIILFTYYAVLNAGIIGIARFRAWRSLNILGFVCTFIVSALWGGRFYQPTYFASVEPFLVLFFLIYTGVAISFTRQQTNSGKDLLDATLVFGTPIVSFALQAALVQRFEFGLAWSALALGLFYLALTALLLRRGGEGLHILCEAFLAFGAIFSTLAIPLAFEGRWTAAAWCVEGAGLLWAGLRQRRQSVRGFGYLLLFGAGIAFLTGSNQPIDSMAVLNGYYLGTLLVSGAALFSALQLHKNGDRLELWETGLEGLLFAWGLLWWFGGGLHEIFRQIRPDFIYGIDLTFIAISCGACRMLRSRLAWPLLDIPALGLLPAMIVFTGYLSLCGVTHPAADGCYLGWPVAFVIWYAILKAYDRRIFPFSGLLHAMPLWLFVVLAAWEVHWQIMQRLPGMEAWALTVWGVVPAITTLLLVRQGNSIPWPVSRHYGSYLGLGCGPLAVCAWLWAVAANLTQAGNPWPLPYLPLLNPLDGTTLLILVTLAAWHLKAPGVIAGLAAELPDRELRSTYGATIFLWLNSILLRSLHHWVGIGYTPLDLFGSHLVQTSISIFWSLSALVLMTAATRRGVRSIWLVGAALLAAVVVKLFLVDLANHGSVERIVSFVVVGILLLVIGWFAPVPPRTGEGGAA